MMQYTCKIDILYVQDPSDSLPLYSIKATKCYQDYRMRIFCKDYQNRLSYLKILSHAFVDKRESSKISDEAKKCQATSISSLSLNSLTPTKC